MARQKKSRKLTDIMPVRKSDKRPDLAPKSGKKLTRYELDAKARAEKRKRKHKGLDSGSRHSASVNKSTMQNTELKDPRIGSRKKVPLMIEMVNKPEKGLVIQPVAVEVKKTVLSPEQELFQLENNECLNHLLDELDAGKTLSVSDQKFVDECLDRIEELMEQLGLIDDEEEEDLLRTFERIDINQFK